MHPEKGPTMVLLLLRYVNAPDFGYNCDCRHAVLVLWQLRWGPSTANGEGHRAQAVHHLLLSRTHLTRLRWARIPKYIPPRIQLSIWLLCEWQGRVGITTIWFASISTAQLKAFISALKTLIACRTNEHYQVSLRLRSIASRASHPLCSVKPPSHGASIPITHRPKHWGCVLTADVFLVYVFVACCISTDEEEHEKSRATHVIFLMSWWGQNP